MDGTLAVTKGLEDSRAIDGNLVATKGLEDLGGWALRKEKANGGTKPHKRHTLSIIWPNWLCNPHV